VAQAWDEFVDDPELGELLQRLAHAHLEESDADVYVALRPRAGALTEGAAVDEVRSLLVEVIPPDKRRHDPTLTRPRWRRLTREQARAVFEYTLSHDLAYDSHDVDEQTARALTSQFLDRFSDGAYFFTAGSHTDQGQLTGWNPLTIHTFDTGVIAIDDQCIGAFWKIGED
jgi:hypothetical protein